MGSPTANPPEFWANSPSCGPTTAQLNVKAEDPESGVKAVTLTIVNGQTGALLFTKSMRKTTATNWRLNVDTKADGIEPGFYVMTATGRNGAGLKATSGRGTFMVLDC